MPQAPTLHNPPPQRGWRDERILRGPSRFYFGRWEPVGGESSKSQPRHPELRANHFLHRILLLVLLGIIPLVGGCGTVHPPSNPTDPIPVYLADYGVHSSVILPTEKGKFVEYVFGDWGFAVENHDWFIPDVPRALFFSTQAAFGRRFLDEAADGHPIIPPGSIPPLKSSVKIMVPRAAEEKVVIELDDRYKADAGPTKTNEENQNVYAKDNVHYWMFNNCNHLSAHILREMGCEVNGITVLSGFSVIQPKPLPATTPPATVPAIQPTTAPVTPPASSPATQPGN